MMIFIHSCNNFQELQCQQFRWTIASYMKVFLMKNISTSFDGDAENFCNSVFSVFVSPDIHKGYPILMFGFKSSSDRQTMF